MPLSLKLLVLFTALASMGAKHVSPNFVVEAPTAELAQKVAVTAEYHREQLAIAWLGKAMQPWANRCVVTVDAGPNKGAGGRTKFKFDQGEVYGWDMHVQGSVERILDSVIPHEVNHTILACHFRRPLPRWADEGAASLIEHDSEKQKQQDLINKLVSEGRRIPLRVLFDMAEYPHDMNDTLALYAEGYSLTQFLVQLGGREAFLRFLSDAPHRGWDAAVRTFYDRKNLELLEREWTEWVMAGSPSLNLPEGQIFAKRESRPAPASANGAVVRSQNPDGNTVGRAAQIEQARQALKNQPLTASADELEAPNPRQRSGQTPAQPKEELFVPRPGPKAATAKQNPARNEIRPLELVRVDEHASSLPLPKRAQPAALPSLQLTVDEPASSLPSAREMFQETELRASDRRPTRTTDRTRNWAVFPARTR